MLKECLESIPFVDEGVYLDCTYGAGGHSQAILESMSPCSRLYAIDQDDEAIARLGPLTKLDARLRVARANFADLRTVCTDWDVCGRATAILADLGVSSPQLDDPHRGFSFRADAPLDMRMDRRVDTDARAWINQCDAAQMRRVFTDLGQLRRPGTLAHVIDRYRSKTEIVSTQQLADLVAAVEKPRRGGSHPATGVFRAIRMHINRELDSLSALVDAAAAVLARGGRLLVICFHSLEVRVVKSALRSALPARLPVRTDDTRRWRLITKARPQATEVEANPRARSACLYVLEKI